MEKKNLMATQCLRQLWQFHITQPEMELSSMEKKSRLATQCLRQLRQFQIAQLKKEAINHEKPGWWPPDAGTTAAISNCITEMEGYGL